MTASWFLVGPTACGKTAVALELAELLPVEVISLDSMNVYRGMNVGTAKPSAAERARVPHHLVDVVDADQSYSVGKYVAAAEKAIQDISSRGKKPLFVGGTPLYLKAMTSGLFDAPDADEALRRELEETAAREGAAALHRELEHVDPVSAGRIHPNNVVRAVRALEVYRTTGRPISALQTEWDRPEGVPTWRVAGIMRARSALYARINARVDAMFAAGLVEEVRALQAGLGNFGPQAAKALGYREVLAYLAGEHDLARAIELVKRNTRHMAKRQMTWFRSFGRIRWFQAGPKTGARRLAIRIGAYLAGAR